MNQLAHQQQPAWHNPLPPWIAADLANHGDPSRIARGLIQTLQAMADAGDVDAQGNILHIFGGQAMADRARCSLRTFWRHVRALESRGHLVALRVGGVTTGRNIANIYGIPAQRGSLDHRRVGRRTQQVLTDPVTGHSQRVIVRQGQQTTLWVDPQIARQTQPATAGQQAETSRGNSGGVVTRTRGGSDTKSLPVVPSCHGGSDMMAHNHSPSHPHVKKHVAGDGGGGYRQRWKLPNLTPADMKNDQRMTELLAEAQQAGVLRSSEADRIWWWSAIEYALRKGQKPGALFQRMLRDPVQALTWIKERDETSALARLKPVRRAEGEARPMTASPAPAATQANVAQPADVHDDDPKKNAVRIRYHMRRLLSRRPDASTAQCLAFAKSELRWSHQVWQDALKHLELQ